MRPRAYEIARYFQIGISNGKIILPATKLYHQQVMRPQASYELNLLGTPRAMLLVQDFNISSLLCQRLTATNI